MGIIEGIYKVVLKNSNIKCIKPYIGKMGTLEIKEINQCTFSCCGDKHTFLVPKWIGDFSIPSCKELYLYPTENGEAIFQRV